MNKEDPWNCIACVVPSYQDEQAQSQCKLCGEGRIRIQSDNTGCTDCVAGQYQNEPGKSVCKECPIGYKSEIANAQCLQCGHGQYTDVKGQPTCKKCPWRGECQHLTTIHPKTRIGVAGPWYDRNPFVGTRLTLKNMIENGKTAVQTNQRLYDRDDFITIGDNDPYKNVQSSCPDATTRNIGETERRDIHWSTGSPVISDVETKRKHVSSRNIFFEASECPLENKIYDEETCRLGGGTPGYAIVNMDFYNPYNRLFYKCEQFADDQITEPGPYKNEPGGAQSAQSLVDACNRGRTDPTSVCSTGTYPLSWDRIACNWGKKLAGVEPLSNGETRSSVMHACYNGIYKLQTSGMCTDDVGYDYITDKMDCDNAGVEFKLSVSAWNQLGGDIDGEAADDESGSSVSLSSDGTTVAIGAYYNDGNGAYAGHVRIYQLDGTAWTQLGGDIDGEAAYDTFGTSVSLSSDGLTVAIGAPNNDAGGTNAGHVRIYHYDGAAWTQVGLDIDGEAAGDNFGKSVSLSSDGTIVAIGALKNDGGGSNAGHVRIYRYDGTAWTQLGGDIDGEAAADQSGNSVSLSSDGTTVAIGAYYNGIRGHVRIYQLDGTAWTQVGGDIDGEAAGDNFGTSVSLSSDGLTVAIGARYNDGADVNAGHVRIYLLRPYTERTSGKCTEAITSAAECEAAAVALGWSDVDLEPAYTTPAYPPGCFSFLYSGTQNLRYNTLLTSATSCSSSFNCACKNDWTQVGLDIDGVGWDDKSGWSVSLSSDGLTVAIGARNNDAGGTNAGHVRIYQLDGTAWTQLGGDIDGETRSDYSGNSVSLSSDGLTVAIGAIMNDGTNSVNDDRGHVRIYGLGQAKPIVVEGHFSTVPPGCSSSSTHLRLNFEDDAANIACSKFGKCLCKSRAPWRGSSEVCRKKQFYKSANYYRSDNICDSALTAPECAAAAVELGLSELSPSTYTEVTSGKCSSWKLTSGAQCQKAAEMLGWSDSIARKRIGTSHYPSGCILVHGVLHYNTMESTKSCSNNYKCACLDTNVPNGCIMHEDGHVTYNVDTSTSERTEKDFCAFNTGKECICKSDGLDMNQCAAATGLVLADLTQKKDYVTYYRSMTTCSPSDSFDNDQECKVAAEWLKSNRPTFPGSGLTDIDPQLLITDTIVFSPLENTNTCFLDEIRFYWKNHLDCGKGGCVCKNNDLPKGCSTYNSKAYWSDNSNDNPDEKYHKVDIIPDTNFIIDSSTLCLDK